MGDRLTEGTISTPSRSFARFPWEPVDTQEILEIDLGLGRLSVDTALSFTRSRAFVIDADYRDVAEVLVLSVDISNNYLFVNSTDGLSVGNSIGQPYSETHISPWNYFVDFLDPVPGIAIEKASNGIRFLNKNAVPVRATPRIQVSL